MHGQGVWPQCAGHYHWQELPQVSFWSGQNTSFVATKVCLSRENICRNLYIFVRDKMILVAAPAYDSTREICTWRLVLVKLVPSDVVEARWLELHGTPFWSTVRHSYGHVPTHRYSLKLI